MWIICNLQKEYELSNFKAAATKLNIELKIIDPTKLQIRKTDIIELYYNGQKIVAPKFMLNWNGCRNGYQEQQIETALYRLGTIVLNPTSEINLFNDKFRWQLMTEFKVVDSLKIDTRHLKQCIDMIESTFSYPLILKGDVGSLGIGVYKIENRSNLFQVGEIIEMLDANYKMHLEQYIDYDMDVRMYIIGDHYHLMERANASDFRANYSQNGIVYPLAQTDEFEQIFKQIRKTYDSQILGIDILVKGDEYYICEINSAPGFKGIDSVYETSFSEMILNLIVAHKNHIKYICDE